MATVTIARSDLWPIGTSVGIYPAGAQGANGTAPRAAAIASATVDSAGLLTVTDAGILSLTRYVAGASVGGTWRYARCRSTLDVTDLGSVTGTGDTANTTNTILNASATTGAFQAGQRITGPGIPAGTTIRSISGSTLTMSAAATADGTTVALKGDGAYVWSAVLRRRRVAIGTS